MTLTIEITPDDEQVLQISAAQDGQDLQSYIQALARREAANRRQAVATRLAAFQAIGSYDTRTGLPPLPDDAIAEVYREREDAQL